MFKNFLFGGNQVDIKIFANRVWFLVTILLIMSVATVTVLSSSWLQPKSKQTEVTLWHCWGSTGKIFLDKVGREFNKLHPEIKLNVVQIGSAPEDIEQKLLTAIAGKVPPDLAMLSRPSFSQFAERGGLTAIDEFVIRDRIRSQDYFPACWDEGVYREKVYAIPFSTDVRALFYNRELFKKAGLDPDRPPKTWKELLEYADKLTIRNKRGEIIQAGFLPFQNAGNSWFYMYAYPNRVQFISADGQQAIFNTPACIQALEYIVNFVDHFGREDLLKFQSGGAGGWSSQGPFLIGKLAMVCDGNWSVRQIREYAPKLDYGVAPMAIPDNGMVTSWSAGFGFTIPRGAKQTAAAWEVLKYYTSPKIQLQLATEEDTLPCNRIAATDPTLMNDPRWKFFVDLMDKTQFLPKTPVIKELWDEIVSAVDQATFHKKTPEQALTVAQKNIQRALDNLYKKEQYPMLNWTLFILIMGLIIFILICLAIYWFKKTVWPQKLLRREAIYGYLFASPWILGFLLFVIGPILVSLILSFCNYEILTPAQWVGWSNYKRLLNDDPIFWKSLWNTVYYTCFGVPLGMVSALGFALLLNQKIRSIALFRTIYYLPSVVAGVAVFILWMWLFNPQTGLLNAFLGLFGIKGPSWIYDPVWSKPSLILMGLWTVGGGTLIYLAGLQGIPEQYYEAAQIDGAGNWKQFIHVTLPMLSPTIFFNLIMGVIGSFQVFTQAYVMTAGGPVDSTRFYVFYLFQLAFQYFYMGYASAMAWLMFLLILILTLIQFKFASRWVYYEGSKAR